MKAFGYTTATPTLSDSSLQAIELPDPVATGHDILVAVEAISVNPVDTKIRNSRQCVARQWLQSYWLGCSGDG